MCVGGCRGETTLFLPYSRGRCPAPFCHRARFSYDTRQPEQAFGFLATVYKSVDAVLALASPSDLAAADQIMARRVAAPYSILGTYPW